MRELKYCGLGDATIVDGKLWIFENAFESELLANEASDRLHREGWETNIVHVESETGLWRVTPFALLRRRITA